MIADGPSSQHTDNRSLPSPEFTDRLAAALEAADRGRGRRLLAQRATQVLPVLLLVGPIIAWHVMSISPNAVHLTINMFAWTAFLLDVGVHTDTSLLRYLGLSALPAVVGVLLFALVGLTLIKGGER